MKISLNLKLENGVIVCTFADGTPAGLIVSQVDDETGTLWAARPLIGPQRAFRDRDAAEHYMLAMATEMLAIKREAESIDPNYVGEIVALKDGTFGILGAGPGDRYKLEQTLGRVTPRDVGKRAYRRGDIIQVENDEQRAARLARAST